MPAIILSALIISAWLKEDRESRNNKKPTLTLKTRTTAEGVEGKRFITRSAGRSVYLKKATITSSAFSSCNDVK